MTTFDSLWNKSTRFYLCFFSKLVNWNFCFYFFVFFASFFLQPKPKSSSSTIVIINNHHQQQQTFSLTLPTICFAPMYASNPQTAACFIILFKVTRKKKQSIINIYFVIHRKHVFRFDTRIRWIEIFLFNFFLLIFKPKTDNTIFHKLVKFQHWRPNRQHTLAKNKKKQLKIDFAYFFR